MSSDEVADGPDLDIGVKLRETAWELHELSWETLDVDPIATITGWAQLRDATQDLYTAASNVPAVRDAGGQLSDRVLAVRDQLRKPLPRLTSENPPAGTVVPEPHLESAAWLTQSATHQITRYGKWMDQHLAEAYADVATSNMWMATHITASVCRHERSWATQRARGSDYQLMDTWVGRLDTIGAATSQVVHRPWRIDEPEPHQLRTLIEDWQQAAGLVLQRDHVDLATLRAIAQTSADVEQATVIVLAGAHHSQVVSPGAADTAIATTQAAGQRWREAGWGALHPAMRSEYPQRMDRVLHTASVELRAGLAASLTDSGRAHAPAELAKHLDVETALHAVTDAHRGMPALAGAWQEHSQRMLHDHQMLLKSSWVDEVLGHHGHDRAAPDQWHTTNSKGTQQIWVPVPPEHDRFTVLRDGSLRHRTGAAQAALDSAQLLTHHLSHDRPLAHRPTSLADRVDQAVRARLEGTTTRETPAPSVVTRYGPSATPEQGQGLD